MAEQGPVKGKPVFNFLQAIYNEYQKTGDVGNVDPIRLLQMADRQSREAGVELVIDKDRFKRDVGVDYPFDTALLEQTFNDYKDGRFRAPVYTSDQAPPSSPLDATRGITPSSVDNWNRNAGRSGPVANYDPYSDAVGTLTGPPNRIDSDERLAAARAVWIDKHGNTHQLTEATHKDHNLVVDYETDDLGFVDSRPGAPILRERKDAEDPYGKTVVSKWGYQPKDRTWLGAAAVGASSGAAMIPGAIAGTYEALLGDQSYDRLKTLVKMRAVYGVPAKSLAMDNIIESGDFQTGLEGIDHPLAKLEVSDEGAEGVYKGLKEDEARWRELAKGGDSMAKLNVEIIDMGDGVVGKNIFGRIAASSHLWQDQYTPRESTRAQQGAFSSMEGLFGGVGNVAGQVGTQMGATSLLARGVMGAGFKSLTQQVVADGVRRTALNQAGSNLVTGTARALEGAQMFDAGVRSYRDIYANDPDATANSAIFGTIVAAGGMGVSRLVGTPWFTKSFAAAGGREGYDKMVRETLLKEVGEKSAVGRAKNVMASTMRWLHEGSEKAWANRGKNVLEAGLKEGLEEGGQEVVNAIGEDVYDMFTDRTGFADSRGPDYSFWGRVMEAAGLGAIAGGGMSVLTGAWNNKPAGHDADVWDAAFSGRSSEVMGAATRALKSGQITQQDLDVIQQDVTRADVAAKDFRGKFKDYRDKLKEQGNISTVYANTMREMDQVRSDVDENGQLGASQTERLKELQQTLDEINTGKFLVDRVVHDANIRQGFRQVLEGQDAVSIIEDPVSSMSRYRDWAAEQIEQAKTIRSVRPVLMQELNETLETLKKAKADSFTEASLSVQAMVSKMQEANAFMREDYLAVSSAYRAINESASIDLSKIDLEDMEEGLPSTLLHKAEAWALSQNEEPAESIGDALDAWLKADIDGSGTTGTHVVQDSKDSDANEAMNLFNMARSAHGGVSAQTIEETSSMLPSEKELLDPANPLNYFNRIHAQQSNGANVSVDPSSVVKYHVRQETITADALSALKAQIDSMNGMLLQARSMPEIVAQLKELAARSKNPPSAVVSMKSDVDAYHDRVAKDASVLDAAIRSSVEAMTEQYNRLGGNVAARSNSIELSRGREQEVTTLLIDRMAEMPDDQLMANKEFALLRKQLHETEDALKKEVLIHQIEQILHDRMKDDAAFVKSFYQQVAKSAGVGKGQHEEYLSNIYLTSAPVSIWQSAAMFDEAARKEVEKHYAVETGGIPMDLAPTVRLMTASWLLRLQRASPRAVVNHYAEIVQGLEVVPSYEQERRIMEVGAFVSDHGSSMLSSVEVGGRPGFLPDTFWLNGFPGTGKTESVAAIIALGNRLTGNVEPRVLIVTPGMNTTDDRMAQAISKSTPGTKVTKAIMSTIPEDLSAYDQVVIDEAHAMSTAEVNALRDNIKSREQRPAILLLGDPNQVASARVADSMSTVMEAGRFAERSIPLTTSFRTGDSQLLNVFNTLRSKLYMAMVTGVIEPDMPTSTYTEGNTSGVEWVGGPGSSIETVLAKAITPVLAGDKAIVIVQDAATRNNAIQFMTKLAEQGGAGPSAQRAIENSIKTMAQGEASGLGIEAKHVYVAIEPSLVGVGYTRMLYTAVSRAKNSVVAYLPNGRSAVVDTVPTESSVASSIEAIKQERLKALREARAVLGELEKSEMPKAKEASRQEVPQVNTPEVVPPIKENRGPGQHLAMDLFSQADASDPEPTPTAPEPPAPVAAGHKSYSDVREKLVDAIFNMNTMELGIFTGVHMKNDDVDAHSNANVWHRARRTILASINENPSLYEVELVYRRPQRFYDTTDASTGAYAGGSVEIRLQVPDVPPVGMVSVAKELGIAPTDPRLYVLGYMPIQETQSNEMLNTGIRMTMEEAAGKEDGAVLYDGRTIPVSGLLPGIPDAGGEGRVDYGAFAQRMANQGNTIFSVSGTGDASANPHLSKMKADGTMKTDGGVVARVGPLEGVGEDKNLITELYLTSKKWEPGDGAKVFEALRSLFPVPFNFQAWGSNPVHRGLMSSQTIQEILLNDPGSKDFMKSNVSKSGKVYHSIAKKAKDTDGDQINSAEAAIGIIEDYVKKNPDKTVYVPVPFMNGKFPETQAIVALRNLATLDKSHVTEPVLKLSMGSVWRKGFEGMQKVGRVPEQQATTTDAPIDLDLDDALYQQDDNSDFQRISSEEAREYVRRTLGNRFVNGQLDFKPNLASLSGIRLHGIMERGRIGLKETDGQVRSDTPRHEALHYVMVHLLSPESATSILKEAKVAIATERVNMRAENVSDRDAHEHLANKYGHAKADEGLVGRFLSWLKGALNRWGLYRIRMEELGKVIDSGYFRTVSPRVGNESLYSEDTSNDRMPLYRVFGSDSRSQRLLRQIQSIIRDRSLFAQPQDGSLGVRQKTLKEVVDMIHNDFAAKAAARPTGLKVNGEDVPWKMLSYGDIVGLRGEDYGNYVYARVTEPVIFESIIREVLPDVRFSDLMPNWSTREEQVSDAEVPVDPDAGSASMANIINSSEKRNPITNNLAIALVLRNMPLLRSVDGVVTETQRPAYHTVTETVLRNAAQGVSLSSKESAMDAMGKALMSQYRAMPDSMEGQHALTLYWKLFATDETKGYLSGNTGREDRKLRSYRWLVKNIERVRKEVGADPFAQAALEERFNMAEALQNALIGQYLQLHTNNYVQSSYFSGAGDDLGQIHSRELNFDKVGSELQLIKEGTDRLFTVNGDEVFVNDNIRSKFALGIEGDVAGAEFVVNPLGIQQTFEGRTKKLVVRSGLRFSLLPDVDAATISRFFTNAGYAIAPQTIEHYLKQPNGGDLAEIMGMWGTAIHAGVAQVMGSSGSWSESLMKQYATSGGLNLAFEDDPRSNLYRPSALFVINRRLAMFNSTALGTDYLRQIYTEDGSLAYVDSIGTQFRRTLPANHPKGYSSAAAEEAADMIVSMDPALKNGEAFMTPLINPRDPRRIDTVLTGMGMQQVSIKSGKAFNNMHPADQEAVIMDRFIQPLFANGRNEVLTITLSPFADRTPTVIKMTNPAGQSRLFQVSGQRDASVKFIDAIADQWVKERFELLQYRAQLAQADIDQVTGGAGVQSMTAQQLEASELIANYHYRLKGDSVLPGLAAEPADPVMNLQNAASILSAPPEGLRSAVEAIIGPMVQQYREGIAKSGALMDNVLRKVNYESRRELARGFVTMSWLADQWVADITAGPDALYKNATDVVKRTSLLMAPAYVPPIEQGQEKSSFIVVDETDLKDLDGQGIETPWGYRSLLRRMGGEFGPLKPGAYKMVYSDVSVIDKASRAMPSPQYYRMNGWFRSLVERSLSDQPELLALWQETLGEIDPAEAIPAKDDNGKGWGEGFARRYWDAADKVAARARTLGVDIGQSFTSKSNLKKGLRMVNELEGSGPVQRLPIDLRFYGFQTDLSRSTENLKVSQATQILFMLGVMPGNSVITQRLQNIDAGVADAFLKKMTQEAGVHVDTVWSRNGFEEWMRKNSLSKAIGKNESTQLIDALMDDGVTINDPMLKQKLVSDFLNMLYREGINPKVHGQQFTQVSSYGLEVIEVIAPLPQLTPEETAIEGAAASIPSSDGLETWTDDYSESLDKESSLYDIMQRVKELRGGLQQEFATQEEGDKVRAETEKELTGLKEEAKMIVDHIKGQAAARVEPVQSANALRGPRFEGEQYVPGEIMLPFVFAKQFGVTDPYMTIEDVRTDIYNRLGDRAAKVFEASMLVYVSRTPASGTSSGNFMRVVGFISDAGNSIYVPAEFNKKTGGDNDGDQLTVLLRSLKKGEDGLIEFDNEGEGGMSNDLLDTLWSYYSNPGNQEHTMAEIGTDGIAGALGTDDVRPLVMHSPATASIQRKEIADGASLVGIIANANKAYSVIMAAWNNLGQEDNGNNLQRQAVFKKFQPQLRDGEQRLVSTNISELLNVALDNVKLMLLGPAGVTPQNINLVLGALVTGMPLSSIRQMMMDPLIQEASRLVLDSTAIVREGRTERRMHIDDALFTVAGRTPGAQDSDNFKTFLNFAHIGEVLSRTATLLRHRNQGVGGTERELLAHVRKLEFILSSPLKNITSGAPAETGHWARMGSDVMRTERLAQESRIREMFDHAMLAKSMSGLMQQLGLINTAQEKIQRSVTTAHPVWRNTERAITSQLSNDPGLFTFDNEKTFEQEGANYFISMYLNEYGPSITLNEKNGPIDMTTRGGNMRFLYEFPSYWNELMASVKADPGLSAQLQDNHFLANIRTADRDGVTVLEVKDSRRVQSARVREMVRTDLAAMSALVDESLNSGWPASLMDQLALYSMVKDCFIYSKSSLLPFISGTAFKQYGQFLSTMRDRMSTEIEGAVDTDFVHDFMAYNAQEMARGRGKLIKQVRADNPSSVRVMPPAAPHYGEGVVASKGVVTLPNMTSDQYERLSAGEGIPSNAATGASVALPTGESSVIKNGMITSSSASRYDPDSDSQPTVLYSAIEPSSMLFTGAVDSLNGTNIQQALDQVLEGVGNPDMRTMAEKFKQAAVRAGIDASIRAESLSGDIAGYIDHNNVIGINRGLRRNAALVTVLHEVSHRFTRHVLSMKDADMTPEERAFKRGVTSLLERAKKLKYSSTFEYQLSSPDEFLAGAHSEPTFQQWLQVNDDGPLSFFDRLVKWFRSLFGLDAAHENLLSEVMDITDGYIEYAIASGRGFDPTTYEGRNAEVYRIRHYNKRGRFNPVDTSKSIEDVKDLITVLQTNDKTGQSPELAAEVATRMELADTIFEGDYPLSSYKLGDRTWSFAGLTESEIRNLIDKEIAPYRRSFEQRRSQEIVDLLNEVSALDTDAAAEAWAEKFSSRAMADYGAPQVREFLRNIDPDGLSSAYIQYSDLANTSRILKFSDGTYGTVAELGLKHVKGFEGQNPIVRVSKSMNGPSIDLFQYTNSPLQLFSTRGTVPHLLEKFMPGGVNNFFQRVSTRNTEGGGRSFGLALTAMAMRQANPDVAIRRVKVLHLSSGKKSSFGRVSVQMGDMLREIGSMKKIPAIWSMLPTNIRSVLQDDSLYDHDLYQQPFVEQLLDWAMENDISDSAPNTVQREIVKQAQQLHEAKLSSSSNLKFLLRERANQIRKKFSSINEAEKDKEYQLVLGLMQEIIDTGVRRHGSNRDKTYVGAMVTNPHNMRSDIIQRVNTAYLNASNKVTSRTLAFQNDHKKTLQEFDRKVRSAIGVVSERFLDVGWQRFEPLFRYSNENGSGLFRIVDKDGKAVRRRLNMVHWDKNDPETKALLKEGALTQAHLDYSNWFLDRLHEQYKRKLVSDLLTDGDLRYRNGMGGPRVAEAEKKAEELLRKNLVRGWVPIVIRPAGEALVSAKGVGKKVSGYAKATLRENRNPDATFDSDSDVEMEEPGRVMNRWMAELGTDGSVSSLGGATRLARLGLTDNGHGELSVTDDFANENITMNMETVLNQFQLAVERSIVHDTESVPVYLAGRAAMQALEADGVEQTNNLMALDDIARRLIYGGPVNQRDRFGNLRGIGTPINIATKAASYSALAFSWPVAVMSGTMNTVSIMSNSFVSWAVKDGFYTTKSATKAAAIMGTPSQRSKIAALGVAFYVHEMSEQDMANTQIRSHTRRQFSSQRGSNAMAQWTDREARHWVMVAQMIEDGSWDAFSLTKDGKISYDEKKDARFYKAGKLTEDGALLRENLRRRLIEQDVVGQQQEGPLKTGYDLMNARTFKVLSDKFVTGGMDSTTQAMYGSFALGRAVGQFRRYMPDRLFNWFGARVSIDGLGRDVVRKDAKGNKMAVWEQLEVESTLNALLSSWNIIKSYSSMGPKEVAHQLSQMSTADKQALMRGLSGFLLMALITGLIAAFADDDDDRNPLLAGGLFTIFNDQRITRILESTASDAFTPWSMAEQSGGQYAKIAPSMTFAFRLGASVFDPASLSKLVPGRSVYQLGRDIYEGKTE